MRQVSSRARARALTSLLLCCTLALLAGRPAPAVAAPSAQSDPSVVGQWAAAFGWPAVPIHVSVLPDGRLLFWGRDKSADGKDVVGRSNTYVWAPNYSTANLYDGPINTIANNTTNLFCSGHSFLPDGRLLVTGGHGHADFDGVGVPDTNIFDYRNNTWTRGPNMVSGRWYPFNVTLASGETLVVSGKWWDGTFVNGAPNLITNTLPQVFTAQGTWRTLGNINRVEQPLYPWLHLLPDGRVFLSGYAQQSYYLDTAAERWTAGPLSSQLGRASGSGIMYDMGRVLLVGGGDPATSGYTEAIDLTQASPIFRAAGQMVFPRRQMVGVLLPTGDVMAFGGTSSNGFNDAAGKITVPELWKRQTETWSAMTASASGTPRLYHATAVLLPDARVLVGGGGLPAAANEPTGGVPPNLYGHKDVEIYSPPYLFLPGGAAASRPVITSAPASVTYGQAFNVGVGNVNLSNVQQVTWVRLPSMTHSFNQDQRMNYLSFTRNADGASLTVTAPPNAKRCPPGHYMLFVVHSRGTPSVAKVVQIR